MLRLVKRRAHQMSEQLCPICKKKRAGPGVSLKPGTEEYQLVCNDCWQGSPHCMRCFSKKPQGKDLSLDLKHFCEKCCSKKPPVPHLRLVKEDAAP